MGDDSAATSGITKPLDLTWFVSHGPVRLPQADATSWATSDVDIARKSVDGSLSDLT